MNTEPKSKPSATPARVLVVDDEEIVLVALRDLLRYQGYEVTAVTEVLRAIELLQQQTYAVVLTDQQMPTLSGLEFLAEVKRLQPEAMRILITAVLSMGTVIDAINKAEVFRFVLKPWQRDELLEAVRAAVERHQGLAGCRQGLAEALKQKQELERRVEELGAQLNSR